jgi:hypothetical protein
VAAIIGLILGVALAIARDILDRRITSLDHVQDVTESPVLSNIGYDPSVRKNPLLSDVGGFAPRTEAFRLLRTNLQFLDLDSQPRSLVITSAVAGEGKTTTATNLGIALAQAGACVQHKRHRVRVGDRRPRLRLDLARQRVGSLQINAAGVDQLEPHTVPFALERLAIPRHPGLLVHHGLAAAHEAVDEGRLADVGKADDCDPRQPRHNAGAHASPRSRASSTTRATT